MEKQPEADGRKHLSGVYLRRLTGLFAEYRPKAEGSLISTFFRSISPNAGEAFHGGLTQSRRLSGAALFRVIAAGYWRDFPKRIDQKPKDVWSQRFFGAYLRRLERLFAGDRPKAEGGLELLFFGAHLRRLVRLFAGHRPKAEGCLELYFFESSQRATGVVFRRGSTQSRRRSLAILFRVVATIHLGSLTVGVERQPEADER